MQIPSENLKKALLKKAMENIENREEYFREFIEDVCKYKGVLEVYLVGSRARGDSKSFSDFDIVVVVDTENVVEIAEEISKLRRKPVPVDIIALRREDLEDPVYKPMLSYKIKLC